MTGMFWIVAIVVFSLVEAFTAGLVSIWFAIGSLAALISSYFTDLILVQAFIFFFVSILSFVLLRKFALNVIKKSQKETDIGRLIGKDILITQTVDNMNNTGMAKINDIEWKVRSLSGNIINEGQIATVEKIDGVKLIVK